MNSYNLGYYIKKRRTELKMTQEDLCFGLCETCTLSRIESGKQDPERSLLTVLLQRLGLPEEYYFAPINKKELETFQLRNEIIACNTHNDPHGALQRLDRLEQLISSKNTILHQFILRSRSIIGKLDENGNVVPYDYLSKRELLLKAIRLTVPKFNLDNVAKTPLSTDEVKIINQLAITYSENGERRRAIEMYRQLLEYTNQRYISTEQISITLPIIAYNYSRLLGLEGRYEEEIEIAEKGRKCCVQYNKCQNLGGLLLNIACALHELEKNEESKEKVIESYYAYKLTENFSSCETLKKYAKETFGISL